MYYIHTNSFFTKIIQNLFLSILLFIPVFVNAQTLEITASSNKTDVLTCEEFIYSLKYKCASTTTNCSNVTMTANIPSGAIFPLQTIGLPSDIASYTLSPDYKTVTFIFKEPLTAGNTGIVEVKAQGECGKPEGTTATMTATILTGGSPAASSMITTTIHSSNKFCPQKAHGLGLALDNSTNYEIGLGFNGGYGVNGFGATSVGNVTMVDNLPPNAVINGVTIVGDNGQSGLTFPSNTCIIDNTPSAPKVTCTFPANTFQVITKYAPKTTVKVDVTYPSASFAAGSSVTNAVSVTYTPEGGSPITVNNGSTTSYQEGVAYGATTAATCTNVLDVTDVLANPDPKILIRKTSYSTIIRPGDVNTFEFNVSNTGNIPLSNSIVEDAIPSDLLVQSVGKFQSSPNMLGTEIITYWIKTVSNPTYTQITPPYTVPTGEEVTHIKVEISSMPSNAQLLYMPVTATLKSRQYGHKYSKLLNRFIFTRRNCNKHFSGLCYFDCTTARCIQYL